MQEHFPPDSSASNEQLNTPSYTELTATVAQSLPPIKRYVPIDGPNYSMLAQQAGSKIETLTLEELSLSDADAILCMGRDLEPDPSYPGKGPKYNVQLTPGARSNVEVSAALYRRAQEEGNSKIELITSARAHNRYYGMFKKIPHLAKLIAADPSTMYDGRLSSEDVAERLNAVADPMSEGEKEDFAQWALGAKNSEGALVTAAQFGEAKRKILQEYSAMPKISEAALQVEYAMELGVLGDSIFEEGDSVDTVTGILFALARLQDINGKKIVVVATKDHMPRVMGVADLLLPGDMDVTFVESDPRLTPAEFADSCARERKSFLATKSWIGRARDFRSVFELAWHGYFSDQAKTDSEREEDMNRRAQNN